MHGGSENSLVSPLLEAVVLLAEEALHPPLDGVPLNLPVSTALPGRLQVVTHVCG